MEFRFARPDLAELRALSVEAICCTIHTDVRPFRGLAGLLDWELAGTLSRLFREGFLTGRVGECMLYPVGTRVGVDRLIIIGAGPSMELDTPTSRELVTLMARTLRGLRVRRAALELPGRALDRVAPERTYDAARSEIGPNDEPWILVDSAEAEARIRQHAQALLRRERRRK